jgi:DNA invertase Pin-like site-specific DNA recombinase
MTTMRCHDARMSSTAKHEATFRRIKEVRAQAIEHTRLARQFAAERRDLMRALMNDGVSQAEIARELGVSRQAVQKMLAC